MGIHIVIKAYQTFLADEAADNQETTQLPDTLQEQVNMLQLKFEEIQREMEEEKAKFKIEKTRLQCK